MNDKTTVQVDKKIKEIFKVYCARNGYKISGKIEQLMIMCVSGSAIDNY
jgi:hypothetical protein